MDLWLANNVDSYPARDGCKGESGMACPSDANLPHYRVLCSQNAPGLAGCCAQAVSSSINAVLTRHPGVVSSYPTALDAPKDGVGGGGHLSDSAFGAGDHNVASRQASWAVSGADLSILPGGCIAHSSGLGSSGEALWQANNPFYTQGGVGREIGAGGSSIGGAIGAQIRAENIQSAPDLDKTVNATEAVP